MFRFTDARSSSLFLPISRLFFLLSTERFICRSLIRDQQATTGKLVKFIKQLLSLDCYLSFCSPYFQRNLSFHLIRDIISTNTISTQRSRIWVGEETVTYTRYLRRPSDLWVHFSLKKDSRGSSSITKLFIYTPFFFSIWLTRFLWNFSKIYYYSDELSLQRSSVAAGVTRLSRKAFFQVSVKNRS